MPTEPKGEPRGRSQQPQPETPRPELHRPRFLAAGVATSTVAALVAMVGVVIARGIFKVPLMEPVENGAWSGVAFLYAVVAFVAGLLATWLLLLLLRTTPSPLTYFGWIIGLITIFTAVLPLTMGSDNGEAVATAFINAAIGSSIASLTVSAVRSSFLHVPPTEPGVGSPFL